MTSANSSAIIKGILASLVMVALMFGCAGTLSYWPGWLFFIVFTGLNVQMTMYLVKHNPELLARRIHSGPAAEQRPAQKIIMSALTFCCLAILLGAGLDWRFGWSHVPAAAVILGDFMIVISYWVFHVVFKENAFAASTIAVEAGQKVISTGPYSIVRHPMYAGALIMFAGMPLALASWWTFIIVLPALPILLWRIFDEEKLLNEDLPGYREYCDKVKWRLIPGVF